MFGIIDDNKKFILLDSDHDKLRGTALLLTQKTESGYVQIFNEDTVDEAIKEYDDSEIETAYTGDSYIKGYAPQPTHEEQSEKRAEAYRVEIDPITSHIQRLRDEEQTEEIVAKITELIAERNSKVTEIKERYPYPNEPQ